MLYLAINISHYVDANFSKSDHFRKEETCRAWKHDDKIYRLVSARSIMHSLALVSHEIGGCQEKGLHNEHWNSRGRGGTREEGKVDRDKAGAIITIFFTRAVFPAGNYWSTVDEAPCYVTPLTRSGFRLRIVHHSHSVPRHSASEIPLRFWTTDENYALDD